MWARAALAALGIFLVSNRFAGGEPILVHKIVGLKDCVVNSTVLIGISNAARDPERQLAFLQVMDKRGETSFLKEGGAYGNIRKNDIFRRKLWNLSDYRRRFVGFQDIILNQKAHMQCGASACISKPNEKFEVPWIQGVHINSLDSNPRPIWITGSRLFYPQVLKFESERDNQAQRPWKPNKPYRNASVDFSKSPDSNGRADQQTAYGYQPPDKPHIALRDSLASGIQFLFTGIGLGAILGLWIAIKFRRF